MNKSPKTHFFNLFRQLFRLKPLEWSLQQLVQGRLPSHWLSKLVPNAYQYKLKTVRKVVWEGITYLVDLSDFVDWHIYWGFREKGRERLFSLIKEGEVFVDIGANIGEFSLKAAQRVGEHGQAFAFEPDPVNFKRLQTNLLLNPTLNITPFQVGLGSVEERKILFSPRSDNAGMKRIVAASGSMPIKGVEVAIRTLDEEVYQLGLSQIDWLKIDVEGYEGEVLKGGIMTLTTYQPTLFIELDDDNLRAQGSSAQAVVEFLEELGYALEEAVTGHPVTSGTDFSNCHMDIWGEVVE